MRAKRVALRMVTGAALVVVMAAGAAAQQLNLMDDRWTGPVTLIKDESGRAELKWEYQFRDPKAWEEPHIAHALPTDMTAYGGFRLRAYLDSPTDTYLKIRFYEKDGDTFEWTAGAREPGWVTVEVADFLTGGGGPHIWDVGDQKRDYRSLDHVRMILSDEGSRTKANGGTVLVTGFEFFGVDEAQRLREQQAAAREAELNRMVDLREICAMDSADWWAGPRPGQLAVSADCVEGRGSLQVPLDLDPGEHLRLERNFLRGYDMVERDFTAAKAFSFAFKTDVAAPMTLIFRLWDRKGGWLEWRTPTRGPTPWRRIAMAMPATNDERTDLKRIGGLEWEARALREPVKGNLWLDDLRLLEEPAPGIEPVHRRPVDGNPGVLRPVAVRRPHPAPRFHIVLLATSVSYALQAGKADQAIACLQKETERCKGLPVELSFGPENTDAFTTLGEAKFTEVLVTAARWCEQNRVPFYIQVAGPAGFATPYEQTKAVFDAAPTWCQGVWLGETPIESIRDGVERLVVLLELAQRRGKRVCFHRMTDYWWRMTMNPGILDSVFSPRFRDTFVPLWENLEPSCEGLTLGTLLGMWMSGRVEEWGISAQSWGWDNMRWGGTNDMPSNLWMRMFLCAIGAGATYLQIEPQWALDSTALAPLREFARMLEAGVIVPSAGPAYTVSLPRVALQSQATEYTGQPGLLSCYEWAYFPRSEQLPREEIFRGLYRASHVYEELLPDTPYGLVAVLPPGPAPKTVRTLTTDGHRLLDGGKWLPAAQGQPKVLAAFREAAKRMPLAADGCLFLATRVGAGDYLAYLIDAEERFPVGVQTALEMRLPGEWRAFDAVTGDRLPMRNRAVAMTVPAGGYRLVRIVRAAH